MTAWPATRELQLEGAIGAVAGIALLVVAIAVDAPYLRWVVLGGIVLAVMAAYPAHWQGQQVANPVPMPAGIQPATGPHWLGRLPVFVASAVCTAGLSWVHPVVIGIAGVVLLDGAVTMFVRAAVIARSERRHGGRIVRVREATFGPEHYYLAH